MKLGCRAILKSTPKFQPIPRSSTGPPPEDWAKVEDVGLLPYEYFLVVLLLKIDNITYIQVRFSGSGYLHNDTWQKAEFLQTLTTFVHYAFLKSA